MTSDNVKTWVYFAQCKRMEFYRQCCVLPFNLRSIKAAFLEIEKAMFTSATLVPVFTVTTPGPYTCSKQSKAYHAKCNFKVNCEKKCL